VLKIATNLIGYENKYVHLNFAQSSVYAQKEQFWREDESERADRQSTSCRDHLSFGTECYRLHTVT